MSLAKFNKIRYFIFYKSTALFQFEINVIINFVSKIKELKKNMHSGTLNIFFNPLDDIIKHYGKCILCYMNHYSRKNLHQYL